MKLNNFGEKRKWLLTQRLATIGPVLVHCHAVRGNIARINLVLGCNSIFYKFFILIFGDNLF